MGVENFMKALNMLDQDVKELKTSRAIEQARMEISVARDAYESKKLTDMEFRKASETLGNNLALRLSGLGASQSQIEGAFKAIAPKPINGAADLLIQQQLNGNTGDGSYGQAYANVEDTTFKSNKKIREMQTQEQLKIIRETGVQQRLTQAAKSDNPGNTKLKPLDSAFTTKLDELDQSIIEAGALVSKVKDAKYSDFVGRIYGAPLTAKARALVDPEFDAFQKQTNQFFDNYRKRITGAGAGVQEIEKLEQSIARINDNPTTFVKTLEVLTDIAKVSKARGLINRAKNKKDVSGFSQELQEGIASAKKLGISDLVSGMPLNQNPGYVGLKENGALKPVNDRSPAAGTPMDMTPFLKKINK